MQNVRNHGMRRNRVLLFISKSQESYAMTQNSIHLRLKQNRGERRQHPIARRQLRTKMLVHVRQLRLLYISLSLGGDCFSTN